MRLRNLLPLAFSLAPLLAGAQATTHVEFDTPRHFVSFFSAKPPTNKPDDMAEHDSGSADVTLAPGGSLYIWDRNTGNMAVKPVGDVGKKWHVTAKDLALIGLVTVHVDYQGEPVAAGRVTLKDKAREQSQILDRAADGDADFYAVQPGTVLVTVAYRSGGEPATPVVQQFTLDLNRRSPDPLLSVAVPTAVETVNTVVAQPATQVKAPSPSRASPIGTALVYLVALALAVAAGYWLYLWAMKNPQWLAARLKKFGVDVPEPPQSDYEKVLADVEPPKPAPPSKIILGNAEPEPAQTAIPHEPRLIKATGEAIRLPQGETVVGREAGLGLSLLGEASVSRRHASISRQGSSISIKDLGSTNGTFVNGRRIDTETAVFPGDDLQFGTVKFRLDG